MVRLANTDSASPWVEQQLLWAYAYGIPSSTGLIKQSPSDFLVKENMPVVPSGEGEHVWLRIRKEKQNTDEVAKQIARYSNAAYRDVGYSGLKDYFAITEQWFSVAQPINTELDWQGFVMPGVEVLEIARHSRKLKRGTHQSNGFEIVVRELSGAGDDLENTLEHISQNGVPNYYGSQRFGRQGNNLPQAIDFLSGNRKVKNRQLRGILISAARSWLFNEVLSSRIKEDTWCSLHIGEPANLDGSSSSFNAEQTSEEDLRIKAQDIHATAPLWGRPDERSVAKYLNLHNWEKEQLSPHHEISAGLERIGASYQRRALRMVVHDLQWEFDKDVLSLSFSLNKGGFATSVLRELIVGEGA